MTSNHKNHRDISPWSTAVACPKYLVETVSSTISRPSHSKAGVVSPLYASSCGILRQMEEHPSPTSNLRSYSLVIPGQISLITELRSCLLLSWYGNTPHEAIQRYFLPGEAFSTRDCSWPSMEMSYDPLSGQAYLEPSEAPGNTYYCLDRGRLVDDGAVYKGRWDVYTSRRPFRKQT